MSPDQSIHIRICSAPAHLPVVRSALGKVCESLGFDEETSGRIVLGVDEALTNIIRHAYDGDQSQRIEIEMVPLVADGRKGLRICLRDFGKVVDRSEIKSGKVGTLRPGGLGVYIMKACMDCVEYRPAEGSGTELTLVKYLPSRKV